MISISKGLAIAAIGIASATTAFAQARHDEKPHGSTKPDTTQNTERKAGPMTGGRHDERPHGVTKKPKKEKSTAGDEKTGKGGKKATE